MSGLSANAFVFVPGQFSLNRPVVPPATPAPAAAAPVKAEPVKKSVPQATEDDWEKVADAKKEEKKEKKPEPVAAEEDDEDDGEEGETKNEKKKRLAAEAEAELESKDDPREHINLVFIGHVDAGKSTLCGQILLSTGMVDPRTIEKLQAEAKDQNRTSWFLAYMMDVDQEERQKGITVEVGRSHFTTPNKRFTILDAPGHKNYVPNMITGVAQADVGVLVISARKGEFEAGFDRSGQTREHALLAKTLGVKKLVIIVNKMDDPTVEWSKDRFDTIQSKLGAYLKSIGYQKDDIMWNPLSGFLGVGVKDPVPADVCPWITSLSLLDTLDGLTPMERFDEKPLRIPVLDKFKESGKLHILGKVETGVLRTGETILCNPGASFKVLQIQNDENVITVARPGENVRVVVKGTEVEEDSVLRGCILSSPSSPIPTTSDLVVQLVVLQLLKTKQIFTAGYECVIHMHTAVEEVSVVKLLDQLDPKTGKSIQKNPKFVNEKAVVIVHFSLAKPMVAERFDDNQQLGRFSLRDEGKTIAFGKILGVKAPVLKKK
eukprot:TRINITY_DN12949_c0_g1_i1.p1 TRINITY_DN12949_c0_g1~~TRINITY_DN12949_c0_g1_i1.p1  ORF type:complete len:562 (+),score=176.15 TRINITY_DN12949_c0_g1_i1:48-1688(+)